MADTCWCLNKTNVVLVVPCTPRAASRHPPARKSVCSCRLPPPLPHLLFTELTSRRQHLLASLTTLNPSPTLLKLQIDKVKNAVKQILDRHQCRHHALLGTLEKLGIAGMEYPRERAGFARSCDSRHTVPGSGHPCGGSPRPWAFRGALAQGEALRQRGPSPAGLHGL